MSKIIALFPCNPLNFKEVDPDFQEEYNSAKILGFRVSLYDHDALVQTSSFINLEKSLIPQLVLMRGYMLRETQYHYLYNHLFGLGYRLVNTPEQYINAHYFPKSYSLIEEYSNKIWFSEDIDKDWIKQISELNEELIIKDYVKSEKGTDCFIIKADITEQELEDKIEEFKKLRGNLFNKGIQFKKVEKLRMYNEQVNEWRFFVLYGKLVSMYQNSNLSDDSNKPNLPNLKIIIDRLSTISNFFTFDIIEKNDENFIIIETGDGSVSGLSPNQNALVFWSKIKEIIN